MKVRWIPEQVGLRELLYFRQCPRGCRGTADGRPAVQGRDRHHRPHPLPLRPYRPREGDRAHVQGEGRDPQGRCPGAYRRCPQPLDALWRPLAGIVPDIILADGDTIGDLTVIHTPGHTPGSICLYSEPDKVLISGDTVFTDGAFRPLRFPRREQGRRLRDPSTGSRRSMSKGLYPGHGEPVDCGGKRHIAAALQLMKGGYG